MMILMTNLATRETPKQTMKMTRARQVVSVVSCGLLVFSSLTPIVAQGQGNISGHARAEVNEPFTDHLVQARDIETGIVVATSELDEETADYELASLPDGEFLVELLDDDGDIICTEGPFEIEPERALHEDRNIRCDVPLAWWLLAAGAAAGVTAGIVTAGDKLPGAVIPTDPTASGSQP